MFTPETTSAVAHATIGLVSIGSGAMTAAVCDGVAWRWNHAIGAGPPMVAVACAAVSFVGVDGGAMTVAICDIVACRWDHAVVARPPMIAVAFTAICGI